ncbi:MAG: YggT family protein [Gemmatimonadota bacterium]|nr:YggT family protein [Gemmatimonadota bacterium]
MDTVLYGLERLIALLRVAFFGLAAALFVVFLLDWLVRTRRINPFNPVARFCRKSVAPLIEPVERRVVRAGGLPSSAPWWALAGMVIAGILILVVLQQVGRWLVTAATAVGAGPSGILVLLVSWSIGLLQIALLVRVLSSWLRIGEYKPWVRWAVVLTDPILRPLRRVIPPLGGMVDITPIIAWFLLSLIQSLLLSGMR